MSASLVWWLNPASLDVTSACGLRWFHEAIQLSCKYNVRSCDPHDYAANANKNCVHTTAIVDLSMQ